LRRKIVSALRYPGGRAGIAVVRAGLQPRVLSRHLPPAVVISRGANRLTLYRARYGKARVVRTYGVATGTSQYPTPRGLFQIVTMQRHPWWYPPDSDWARGQAPVPPGPNNPLGTRWMGISRPAWDPRHAQPDLDRLLRLPRLHPHAHPRRPSSCSRGPGRDAGADLLGARLAGSRGGTAHILTPCA
jgi:hypothetical protein